MNDGVWYVYLLGCQTGRIYTGVTPDPGARLVKHASGRGAMFTRINRPERLLAAKPFASKVEAMQLEYQIKRLSKPQKQLLATHWCEQHPLDQLAQQFPALIEYIV